MSAKFIDVYPVVTQHQWTSANVRKVIVGSIPTLASKISNLTREVVLKLNGAGHPGRIVEFQQPFSEIFSNLGVECSKGRIE